MALIPPIYRQSAAFPLAAWVVLVLLIDVAHGVPYLALVWSRPAGATGRGWWAGRHGLALFLSALVLFAFLEEGLWDGLVWREHGALFSWFQQLPALAEPGILRWLVPLLALP